MDEERNFVVGDIVQHFKRELLSKEEKIQINIYMKL